MYYKVLIFTSNEIELTITGLEKLVDNELIKGWKPLGGISVLVAARLFRNEYTACQAVTYSDWA